MQLIHIYIFRSGVDTDHVWFFLGFLLLYKSLGNKSHAFSLIFMPLLISHSFFFLLLILMPWICLITGYLLTLFWPIFLVILLISIYVLLIFNNFEVRVFSILLLLILNLFLVTLFTDLLTETKTIGRFRSVFLLWPTEA